MPAVPQILHISPRHLDLAFRQLSLQPKIPHHFLFVASLPTMATFKAVHVFLTALCLLVIPTFASTFPHPATLQARDNPAFPKPQDDPFYKVPANISAYKVGDIIRSRPIPTLRFGWEADRAYQILYRTQGEGYPDATVATAVAPRFPAGGPPKIVTVITPANAAALNCAPSYTYIPLTTSPNNFEILALMSPQTALHQGWWALIPDFEGSRAAWLVGHVEGQASLDAMKAMLKFKQVLPNPENARFAVSGYSGGAHGGIWAAQLAASYAPEVNIVGYVLGGVPAELQAVSKFMDGSPTATLLYIAAAGLGNGYPEIRTLFNSRVKPGNSSDLLKLVQDGTACADVAYKAGSIRLDDGFTKDEQGRGISQAPLLLETYQKEDVDKVLPAATKSPIYIIHTTTDEIIPYAQADAYVKSQCSKGARIEFATINDGVHVEVGFRAQPVFVSKMQDYFLAAEGKFKLPTTCTRTQPAAPYPGFNDIGRLLLGDSALRLAMQAQSIGFGPQNARFKKWFSF